jgi:hypothetical protein
VISQKSDKDLSPMTQSKMFKIAFYLYDKNGIGHRLVERNKDFVMGDGMTYDCEVKEVKILLNKFWNLPVNNLEMKQ